MNSIQSCSKDAARHPFCSRQPSSCSRPSRTASSVGWAGRQMRSERPTQGPPQRRASAATCPYQNAIPFLPMCASNSRSSSFESQLAKNPDYAHDSLGYTLAVSMQIDLHGYHPRQIVWNGALAALVEQAWEMGESELILIHGHGRNRGCHTRFREHQHRLLRPRDTKSFAAR